MDNKENQKTKIEHSSGATSDPLKKITITFEKESDHLHKITVEGGSEKDGSKPIASHFRYIVNP